MKLGFVTTFDASDVSNWSGTPLHMAKGFEALGIPVEYIGKLKRYLPPFFKAQQCWKKFAAGQRESPRFNIMAARQYSAQVAQKLATLTLDAIIAPQINPICYLDCRQPLVLWTDGLYASLLGFYPGFSNHSASSIHQGNTITRECLSRCQLAIFSSEWAARSAMEIYGISPAQVKVVPFGANIQCQRSLADIHTFLKNRRQNKIKLLFLGKHWERKGGALVFAIARALHASGHRIELNFVGCYPPKEVKIPDYIQCHGFISKRTTEGSEKITRLLSESHFLLVPSQAEAYGIVFCEANAFGLPCLTTSIGGIPTIIKNNINGQTFALSASIQEYCDYIVNLMTDYTRYEALALSAFNEFKTRLNWEVATRTVKKLVENIL